MRAAQDIFTRQLSLGEAIRFSWGEVKLVQLPPQDYVRPVSTGPIPAGAHFLEVAGTVIVVTVGAVFLIILIGRIVLAEFMSYQLGRELWDEVAQLD